MASDIVERPEWRCFHCGDLFTSAGLAREHFGNDDGDAPACLIKGAEGGLLKALRGAEDAAAEAYRLMHDECSDFAKAYYAASGRHGQALMSAEELGYERGLRDARAEAAAHIKHQAALLEEAREALAEMLAAENSDRDVQAGLHPATREPMNRKGLARANAELTLAKLQEPSKGRV